MRVVITFDDGDVVTLYPRSPLDLAQAILRAYDNGDFDFQDRKSVEGALREHNTRRILE